MTTFYPYPELEVVETAPGVFGEKYYMIISDARLSVQDRSAWPPLKNYWLLGDHLGSTAITVDGETGNRVTELRYYPYGGARYDAGSQLTNYWFTGQRREASTGLYFYQSRWYDPIVGRFLAADTIVPEPGNPQALNRYSYVLNNPVKYRDPSGHFPIPPINFGPLLHVMVDFGFINPMAPFYLAPVALGVREQEKAEAGEAHSEALILTTEWYFEQGEAERTIRGESQIIDALIRDEGVAEARRAYLQGNRQDMVGIDKWDDYEFGLPDMVRELKDVVEQGDWSTSFLGGYAVEIEGVSQGDSYDIIEMRVINDTGWASATRMWSFSFKQNEGRSEPGPGGTLFQTYIWWERIPR